MSSREVAQTVAKKLKYYLDVKRREDGFDLSGPYLPKEDPNPLRAGPTLAYDGIHDRSLKHYFHNNTVKKQLQHMTVPSNMHRRREKSIRKFVDETMASVDYRLKAGPISPYSFPQTFQPVPPPHRPKALRTVDEYFRTTRGSRRRKLPTNIVGKARRITRRSPPQHVHKDERERIVNMASKLIVATETVALPQQKKQSKGFQASEKEFPRLERRASKSGESSTESAFTSGHESEGSIHSRTPCPPKREKPSSASHRRRPQSSFFKSSSFDNPRAASGVHVLLPNESSSDHEKIKYLMDRMNLDGRGTSVMAAPRDFNRPKSAAYPLKSTATTGVETDLPDYTDDDFCSDDETPKATARSPRVSAWSANEDMIDMCTQTVVHSGTQTKFPEFDDLQHEREVVLPKNLSWVDKADDVTSRPPVAVATTGASTSDVLTSTSHETQTRNRDLEPKVITYEVYVQTGDRLGAGSKVNVKITLFGEYGNSGERQLLRSKIHRNKFQRGQVDVFAIDSLFLGKLQNIRIGHNETRLGYGWFLDKVYIKEGVDATRSFEFRCNRWLSSRDDDGQIMRDLPLYDVVPASHVEAILPREPERDAFYSNADSDSTHSENDESPPEVEPRINESTRKKSKNKTPTTSKSKSKTVDEVDGFKGTKAEDLFEVGDDDEEEDNEDRFFDPEDEYESERSDDENLVDRKEPQRDNKVTRFKNAARATRKEKKREQESNEEEEEKEKVSHESKKNAEKPVRFSHVKTAVLASRVSQQSLNKKEDNKESSEEKERDSDEQKRNKKKLTNVATVMRAAAMKPKKQQVKAEEKKEEVDEKEESESEEEQQEEKEVQKSEESEDELEEKVSPQKVPKGAHHLRVITTALSPFLKNRQGSHPPPSPIPEEPPETPEKEPKKTTEKPREKTEDSDEDEPAVEFTNEEDEEEDKKPERPSSARSDDYDEGFRAGIRRKQEEERKRHRESITESEFVLKSGQSIHDAAKAGNLPRIKELIQVVPAMKNTRNEKGMGPLHIAASNGHLDCVKWLAVSGVDLADETPTGYTAMHLAAMNGHVNCMMILAAMGSTVSCKTVDNFTPIHLAAMSGHIECVKWLLANRAQVEVEDMNGRTALDIAEEYGHEAIQKLLQKFKKELKRQDSTLAQLMTVEKRRKSVDSITSDNDVAPSKVSDSGVGGMESEEDNWISDTEEDVTEDSKQAESSANRRASTSSRDRPDSASRSRTDNIVTTEEKKKMFQEQRQKMKKRHSSFLDSIRMDVEDANQEEF